MNGDSTGSDAGSSPGEGSPWAEQEVLAGSPVGRTPTIAKPPEVVASRAGDLTPWSAGGPGLGAPIGISASTSVVWRHGSRGGRWPLVDLGVNADNASGRLDICHQVDSAGRAPCGLRAAVGSARFPPCPAWKPRPEVKPGSGNRPANAPPGKAPRGTVGARASSTQEHPQPVDFVVECAPVMTPNVAGVLARIVRTLRDHQKREAA